MTIYRSGMALVVTLGLAAVAGQASAAQPSLEAYAAAGACGGSLACYSSQDNLILPATHADTATASVNSTFNDPSYANAYAGATFGALHAYADAYRAPSVNLGDAQSTATAEFIDSFKAQDIVGGLYHLDLNLDGSHTPNAGIFGLDVGALISYAVTDDFTHDYLALGTLTATDAQPQIHFLKDIGVAAGHGVTLQVDLIAHAYTLNYDGTPGGDDPVYSDYKNTLHASFYSDAGGLVGVSGHDYSLPTALDVGGVPEPATWALMLLGFGGLGALLRHRRATATAVPARA